MELPARGDRVRQLGLALPPQHMPRWRGTRPLKRWRYVGYYSAEMMLCAADARIGPVPQRWWAVAEPDGTLRGKTTLGRGGVDLSGSRVRVDAGDVRIDLALEESPGVETATAAGSAHIWTRKQAQVPARGAVTVDGVRRELDGVAFIDDSAGYHPRRTAWMWSAGNGVAVDGRAVGWNLVTGIHDAPRESERTLWVDGNPQELGPVTFAPDLSRVTFQEGGSLDFTEWSAREEHMNLLLMRSDYRQPFGTFAGSLPGGIELAAGYGVMEQHDVRW
ncbi:MAG TPA: DUF2804 family protein [Solirubrobacterales bacterium]|nr:DUF2804 family protein [Solirubrobacterales bacterium]